MGNNLRELLEIKNIIEIKNLKDRLNTRLETAKDKISELEVRCEKIILDIAKGGKENVYVKQRLNWNRERNRVNI